jgi:acyl-CoA thioester hydrolase
LDPSFFHAPIAVRFKDIDAMGHVNNAVFTTYFEEARAAFCRQALGLSRIEDFDFLVARIEIDYRRPLRYGEPLAASVRVAGVGNTSFTLEYRLTVPTEEDAAVVAQVVAEGRSVQVFFDYAQGAKKPVPEGFLDKVRGYLAPGVV